MRLPFIRNSRGNSDKGSSVETGQVLPNVPFEIVLPVHINGILKHQAHEDNRKHKIKKQKSGKLKRVSLSTKQTHDRNNQRTDIRKAPSTYGMIKIKGIQRLPSNSTRSTSISTTSNNNQNDNNTICTGGGLSKYSLGTCRRMRSSVRHCLWRSALDKTDGGGPISHVDELCRDQVVSLMSRNDVMRKKLLDDMLNHGEF